MSDVIALSVSGRSCRRRNARKLLNGLARADTTASGLDRLWTRQGADRVSMRYDHAAIADTKIPRATAPIFQHLVNTYAAETNKVVSVWRSFAPDDLGFRPHPRSSSVEDVLKHQLLSERRFFGEFLGTPEPPPAQVLPTMPTLDAYDARFLELARPRLELLASRSEPWWLERVPFFDVERERIWVFWRRVLHTAHHRTQLTVYLRLLGKMVPATYGPTADVTWEGADPTRTVEAAGRGSAAAPARPTTAA